jgi:hypothetical protein
VEGLLIAGIYPRFVTAFLLLPRNSVYTPTHDNKVPAITMRRFYAPEPAEYTGEFSMDTKTLHANIKLVKPDYEPGDPLTWPRMLHSDVQVFFQHKTKPGITINKYFNHYPLNFTPKGFVRSVVELPKADYEEWMRFRKVLATHSVIEPLNKENNPASTYERIMQNLAEQDADFIATVPKADLIKAKDYTMTKRSAS